MKKLNNIEQKKVLLNILIKFDEFCSQNNLTCYLTGGTLLGAIRHKGFIPWDDDIDVCMPRKDFNKLISLAKESEFLKNADFLKITNFHLNNSNYPFIKILDVRTHINLEFNSNKDSNHMWIDVFPVDNISESSKVIAKIYKKVDFWRKILMLNMAKPNTGTTFIKKIGKTFAIPIAKLFGTDLCNNNIEKISNSFNKEETSKIACITWGLYGPSEVLNKNDFIKSVSVTFEGHSFKAPVGWDKYLHNVYGNYMELPPISERKSHNFTAYIDTTEN